MHGLPVEKHYPLDMLMVASCDDIFEKVPEGALQLMENWPEIEAELARRGI